MKRLDDDKVSFVEFLGSIKFPREQNLSNQGDAHKLQFARLRQRTRRKRLVEDRQLIRSAN